MGPALAASLAPNPELAGLETSSRAVADGTRIGNGSSNLNVSHALTDVPSLVSDVAQGLASQGATFGDIQGAGGAALGQQAVDVADDDDDVDDDDDDDDDMDVDANGEEDGEEAEGTDQDAEVDADTDSDDNGEQAGAQAGEDEQDTSMASTSRSAVSHRPAAFGNPARDIAVVAEMDPDLYGLRRSVSWTHR